jgi:hypothetical protein
MANNMTPAVAKALNGGNGTPQDNPKDHPDYYREYYDGWADGWQEGYEAGVKAAAEEGYNVGYLDRVAQERRVEGRELNFMKCPHCGEETPDSLDECVFCEQKLKAEK